MNSAFRDDCEVAVVGAGPYGLSLGAHLNSAGIETRVFGRPMSFWRENMPKGMKLRSPWAATHIVDPDNLLSLDAYAAVTSLGRPDPLPLEDFVRYGEWFQKTALPDLDTRHVATIESAGRGFSLEFDDGTTAHARRVVVAMGLANQEFHPPAFAGLPIDIVSHTADHADLGLFNGQRVAVVGRGQSATESAALLAEAGADVTLICRGDIHWLGAETSGNAHRRDLYWRLHKLLATKSGVGPFPLNWANEQPDLIRRLPRDARVWLNAKSLRPGAAGWVRPRVAGVAVEAGRPCPPRIGRHYHSDPDRDSRVEAELVKDASQLRLDEQLRRFHASIIGFEVSGSSVRFPHAGPGDGCSTNDACLGSRSGLRITDSVADSSPQHRLAAPLRGERSGGSRGGGHRQRSRGCVSACWCPRRPHAARAPLRRIEYGGPSPHTEDPRRVAE